MNAAWSYLILAGLFEVGFTTGMTLAQQGKRWGWAVFFVCIAASFQLLNMASRTIPLGVAYAVWTGIGAVGTLLVSALVFRQPLTTVQIALVLVLVGAVAGLKVSSGH